MKFLEAIRALFSSAPRRRPAECFEALRSGNAILVDVREPGEWAAGVVQGAVPLPLTDLVGSRQKWGEFIAAAGKRDVLVYCKAGGRSAIAARILRREGIAAFDAGGIGAWRKAGWKIEPPPRDA